jgi:hypothetical protein
VEQIDMAEDSSRMSPEVPLRDYAIADAYRDICAGAPPWVALNEFQHAWYEAPALQRAMLVAAPLPFPPDPTEEEWPWAVFCAAGVEWLCAQAEITCPAWVLDARLQLAEPWYDFDSPGAHKEEVRAYLRERTPQPFARRNIYCGDKVLTDKRSLVARQ